MAKEHNIHSHIHVEVALLALESATASLPVILGDLNRGTFFLRKLKISSPKPIPIHGIN
jgi:hypothetical protein